MVASSFSLLQKAPSCQIERLQRFDSERRLAVVLEILHGAFVFLGFFATIESPQVSAFSGRWILFARIEPILTRLELANHVVPPALI